MNGSWQCDHNNQIQCRSPLYNGLGTHLCWSTFWISVMSLFEVLQRELVKKIIHFFVPFQVFIRESIFRRQTRCRTSPETEYACVFCWYRFAAGSANTSWSAADCSLYMFGYTPHTIGRHEIRRIYVWLCARKKTHVPSDVYYNNL
jgi:hypothetical protein